MAICVKINFHWIFVSMFKNMVICVEISLLLDISVKYAQCVKICLFLKCVQFPKVLCSVSGEAKGRRAYITHVSHLSKGGVCCRGTSPYRLFSTGILLALAHGVPVGMNTPNVFAPTGTQQPGARRTTWCTSYLKSLKHIDYRGFKSK
jgi:hypothetical protein